VTKARRAADGRVGPRRFLRREPTQRRSRALVEALLVAADQMLRTFGDERQVTIERIISRAGVSLASFYEYFTDKDSLAGALVDRATRENFQTLLAELDASAPTTLDQAVRFVSERVAITYLAHPARTRLWLMGIGRLQLTQTVTRERDRFASELARRALRFRPERAEPELTAAMIAACDAAIGVVVGELYRDSPRPRAEVADLITRASMAILEP
jgi:AcrR family transcriptional regulator